MLDFKKMFYLLDHKVSHVQLHVLHRLHDALEERHDLLDRPQLGDLVVTDRSAKFAHQVQDVVRVGEHVQNAVAGLLGDQIEIETLHDRVLDSVLTRKEESDQGRSDVFEK